MPKFRITIAQTTYYDLTIEAETRDQAVTEAYDNYRSGDGDEYLGDASIESIEEINDD